MTANQERKLDEMYGMVYNLDKLVAIQEEKYESLRENFLSMAKEIIELEKKQQDILDDKNKVLGVGKWQ